MSNYTDEIFIGIDTGVNTGIALWNATARAFELVECVKIHTAMQLVANLATEHGGRLEVRVEDARQRKWIKTRGPREDRARLQGAGSVKRDCTIWEEYLIDLGVNYRMVPPKNNKTKLDAKQFRTWTGWSKQTNEHGRDAAMLVFGIVARHKNTQKQ